VPRAEWVKVIWKCTNNTRTGAVPVHDFREITRYGYRLSKYKTTYTVPAIASKYPTGGGTLYVQLATDGRGAILGNENGRDQGRSVGRPRRYANVRREAQDARALPELAPVDIRAYLQSLMPSRRLRLCCMNK
jgi:hypothetical protein